MRWIDRRLFVCAALLLAAGALVNVAVAWALLAAASVTNFSHDRDVAAWYDFAERHNLQRSDTRFPFRLKDGWRFEGVGFTVARVDYVPVLGGIPIFGSGTFLVYSETGFPMRCLHGWVFEHRDYCHCVRVDHSRVRTRARFFTTRADVCLPLRPIWSGFVVNMVLYASLLWAGLFAPFALRRALRRGRRLCEKCGYPIGVSPVCTECGAPVDGISSQQESTS